MIGYFDTQTLKVTEREAVINFISATNGDDVTEVKVNTAKGAKMLAHNLECQRDRGITSYLGEAMVVSGPLTLNPGRNDEGVLMVEGDEARMIPVKLDFDQSDDHQMPERSLFSAFGQMIDGALVVYRAAAYELSQIPRQTMAPASPN